MVDQTTDVAHEQFATAAAHRTAVFSHLHLRQTSFSVITYSFIANCQSAVVHKNKTKRRSKIYKSQYILRYNILTVKLQSIIREMRDSSIYMVVSQCKQLKHCQRKQQSSLNWLPELITKMPKWGTWKRKEIITDVVQVQKHHKQQQAYNTVVHCFLTYNIYITWF